MNSRRLSFFSSLLLKPLKCKENRKALILAKCVIYLQLCVISTTNESSQIILLEQLIATWFFEADELNRFPEYHRLATKQGVALLTLPAIRAGKAKLVFPGVLSDLVHPKHHPCHFCVPLTDSKEGEGQKKWNKELKD